VSLRVARDGRPLIFFAVLIFHIAVVALLLRARQIAVQVPFDSLQLLVLAPSAPRIAPPAHAGARQPAAREKHAAPNNSITAAPEEPSPTPPPPIDWDQEAELAAQNAISSADKEAAYRNLAALTPAQRDWIKYNDLAPAAPGIPWAERRVEIVQGGLPIIHINDHCVAIPFLMMMVFCKIGHIEPRGDLFKHMRDRRSPSALP
jgi:hypothetical protein